MASAGVPRAVSAQKGQTKGAIRHPCTLDAFKTLNLIQIKTGATDNKKPRRVTGCVKTPRDVVNAQ